MKTLSRFTAPLSLAILIGGLALSPAYPQDTPPKVPEKPLPERVREGIESLRQATTSIERARARHRLLDLGPEALPEVRKHASAEKDAPMKAELERMATRLLSAKLLPIIQERMSTGLFFDGQYGDLKKEQAQAIPALLNILGDEAVADFLRRGAINALADLATPDLLPALRTIEGDVLMATGLREELGTLLAILGDNRKVDRQIRQISKHLDNPNPAVMVGANVQLAHLYYKIRKYNNATECYERILGAFSRIEKDPRFRPSADFFKEKALHHYNAACSYSLAGKLDKAKENLSKAVEIDATHIKNMEKDGDLKNVRTAEDYAEFRAILKKMLEDRSL